MSTLKKVQLVMLPTNEKAKDHLIYKNQDGTIGLSQTRKYYLDSQKIQHLYFLSDEEIKEGDWFVLKIDTQLTIYQCDKIESFGYIKPKSKLKDAWGKEVCHKIIATTDSSLKVIIPCPDNKEGCEVLHTKSLPQPSQSFLEVFVREYNKGHQIKEVLVEYEEY